MKRIGAQWFRILLAIGTYACVASGAGADWPGFGAPVAAVEGSQYACKAVSDGAGGSICLFYDDRVGALNIFAQRLDGAGDIQWGSGGVVVFSTRSTSLSRTYDVAADGAGGALLTWVDVDDHWRVQRIDSNGQLMWGSGGIDMGVVPSSPSPAIITDGAGGAIAAILDIAQRFDALGNEVWTPGEIDLPNLAASNDIVFLVPDGSSGVLVFPGNGTLEFRVGTESLDTDLDTMIRSQRCYSSTSNSEAAIRISKFTVHTPA